MAFSRSSLDRSFSKFAAFDAGKITPSAVIAETPSGGN
jgi:hypothetical protein